MRGVLFFALLLGCGGPGGVTPRDGGPHDGSAAADADASHDAGRDVGPDTNCPILDPLAAFRCSEGHVYGASCTLGPCPTCTSAELTDFSCPNGCAIDAPAFPQHREDVCAPLARVGDECTVDADCTPAEPDDGFGGPPVPETLHCDTAHFACARDVETCDGVDDDYDGTIDEGCACAPRTTVLTSVTGIPVDAAFGPDRILISTWSDLASALELTDADGVHVASQALDGGVMTPSRIASGFVFAEGAASSTVTIRRIGDDGRDLAPIVLTRRGTGHPYVAAWGADFLVLDPTATTTSWAIARIGASGSALATGMLDADPSLRLTTLADGTPLVVDLGSAAPIRAIAIAPDGTTREVAPGSASRVGPSTEIAVTADRVWVPAHDASGHAVLAAIDRATGAWAETIALGIITTAPGFLGPGWTSVHLTAHGDRLFASWPDAHEHLRVLVLDTTGARLGTATVTLPSRTTFRSGDTSAGVRIVAGPTLVSPCDAL